MDKEKLTEQFVTRLTPTDAAALDRMMVSGGYRSRAELTGSLVRSILVDDAHAHGEQL